MEKERDGEPDRRRPEPGAGEGGATGGDEAGGGGATEEAGVGRRPEPGETRRPDAGPLNADGLVLREVQLPLRSSFRISSGSVTLRRILLLELRDAEGATAWSECVAQERPHYGPETVDTAWWAIREWLAPRVLGRRFEGPEAVHEAVSEGVRGHRMARAAVEMGFWALAARREGVSLSRLLGGIRKTVETGISLGIQPSPAELAERVGAALEDGYRRIKVKIEPEADVAYLEAAREAVGDDGSLMADANAAYTRVDHDRLAGFDRFDLLMLEQPLPADDLTGHAELQVRIRTPLCLDEAVTSPARARDALALDAARVLNLKPGRVGGFHASLAIHELCARREVPLWCGGMLESGVGRAHNVALASLPAFRLPGDLSASRRYWEEDVVEPEWTLDAEGRVRVPTDRPGIGVEVRRERVEELTVRSEELRA